jgi:hypothetical protein
MDVALPDDDPLPAIIRQHTTTWFEFALEPALFETHVRLAVLINQSMVSVPLIVSVM